MTKDTTIRDEDLIPLDREAFRFKKDGSTRAGNNIHGWNGSATRAKNRAVTSIVNFLNKLQLTPQQKVLALREASTHPQARVLFKSAGLIDCDDVDTLKHMVSQSDKLIGSVMKKELSQGRVSNERQRIVDSLLLSIVDTPTRVDN